MLRKIVKVLAFLLLMTLSANAQKKYLTLTSPTDGDILEMGKIYNISWTSVNVNSVSIEYSIDNGINWKLISKSKPSIPRNYKWQIPELSFESILLMISDSEYSNLKSVSKKIYIVDKENNILLNNVILPKYNITPIPKIKIMPLGNSITRGVAGSTWNVGYRRELYQKLTNDGYSIDFVGSAIDGIRTDFDMEHEGHGGWHAEHPNNKSKSIIDSVSSWLSANSPDIILLHIGTNDIGEFEINGENVSHLINEVSAILDSIEVYEINSGNSITIFLAQIINRLDDMVTPTINENIITSEFNDEILNLANTRNALGDQIIVVDFESELIYPDDLSDGVHPNDNGYSKMADLWFNELISHFGNIPQIVSQPSSEGIFEGEVTQFSVIANGEEPLTYQWKKNDVEISGANSSIYETLPAFLIDNETVFTCTISNSLASITSNSVYLYVNSEDSRITGGELVYYDFDEGEGDTIYDKSNYGTPLNLSISTNEAVTWKNNSLQINSPVIISSENNSKKITDRCIISNEITIEAWVKPSNLTQSGSARIITNSIDKSNRNFTLGQNLDSYQMEFRTANTSNSGFPLNSGMNSANLNLVQVVFTRSNVGTSKIFVNGIENVIDTTNFKGELTNWDTSYQLAIANEFIDEHPFEGLFYLISIYDRQLSLNEIEHNYTISKPKIEKAYNLLVYVNGEKNIVLNWSENSNEELGFIIERSGNDTLDFSPIDTVLTNEISYIDTSVNEGIRYFYRVKAFNLLAESEYSNYYSSIIPLTSPTELTGSVNEFFYSSLNWIDNSKGEFGFLIEGKADHQDSIYSVIDTSLANTTNYVDNNPKYYTPFIYRVHAFTTDTSSDYSNEISIDVVGVNKKESELPQNYKIYQNYPNPFNPETLIKYAIPYKSNVKIEIYNLLGQLIKTLVNHEKTSGYHEEIFNASNFPSGVYYCTFYATSFNESRKYQSIIKLLHLK